MVSQKSVMKDSWQIMYTLTYNLFFVNAILLNVVLTYYISGIRKSVLIRKFLSISLHLARLSLFSGNKKCLNPEQSGIIYTLNGILTYKKSEALMELKAQHKPSSLFIIWK